MSGPNAHIAENNSGTVDRADTPRYRIWLAAVVSVLGARSFSAAAAFLCNVLVARQLGNEDFGKFYLLFSIMTVVAGLTGPALDTSLVRFASKRLSDDPDSALPYFKAMLVVKLLVFAATLAFFVILVRPILQTFFVWSADDPNAVRYYYVMAAFVGGAVVSMWGFSQSYFQSHQRFGEYSGFEFFSSLLRLGLVLVLMGLGSASVLLFITAYVAAPMCMMLISFSMLPRALFQAVATRQVIAELFQFAKWVAAGTLFATLTHRLDILLLNVSAFEIPHDDVGRYSAAVSIALAGELVLLTFYNVLLPKASRLKTAVELRNFIAQLRIPSLLFFLGTTITMLIMPYFRKYVLGPEYLGAEVYYSILIMGIGASITCMPPVTALYSVGKSGLIAGLEGTRMLLTLAIGLYVVPRYGAWGMAMTMAGVRGGMAVVTYLVAHQTIRILANREWEVGDVV